VLRAAVSELPKRARAALVLRFFGDMSVTTTAEVLGIPEGSVKRLTHEAIATLRKNPRLADLEVGDE
jgi:RNA polymerase sigma factor (sigma-70 family)